MANNNNASNSRACCPIVYGMVPATMPQAGMAAQPMPMQMFMVAPMAGPLMMSQLDNYQMGYSAMAPGIGNVPFAWAQDSSWPMYTTGAAFVGEEAPQQLPMESIATKEFSLEATIEDDRCDWKVHAEAGYSQEDVPTQIHMQSMMLQSAAKNNASVGVGTLRRRKGQDWGLCYNQEPQSCGGELLTIDDQQADQALQNDNCDAQAREIANQVMEQFQAGGNAQQSAVASFERLAFSTKISSRAAQMILDETSMTDAAAFATGLRGHIRSAVQSKHANHVVQKITEVMPAARASFVVEELKGFGHMVVRQCFGCRVICRILEHLSPSDTSTLEFLEEVLADLEDLCSHPFGSFVVRHLLEFGLPAHKQRVVKALRTDLLGLAKHKFGSHVVEAALRHASADDQEELAKELLQDKVQLMVLAGNQFGRHVVRAMLTMPGARKTEAVHALRPMEDRLKSSRYGKSVLQALRASASV